MNTSESHLHIDHVDLASGGRIGMTHCPGRAGVDGSGRHWHRNLADDLAAIENWGATRLVTLIERREFEKFAIPDLDDAVHRHQLGWHHVPIPDMQPPDATTMATWRRAEPHVIQALLRGESVVFHCAAGLGRTGTMAAKILVGLGMSPPEAIALVRCRRPGAIETAAQEAFVADGQPFVWTRP